MGLTCHNSRPAQSHHPLHRLVATAWSLVAGVLIAALLSSAGARADALKVGDPAPPIKATDHDGKSWSLSDFTGKSAVILYFYPKDDTPGCTKEACGFRDRLETLKSAGVHVVGVSRDDAESHRKFRERHQLNFPLLVDTDGKITEAFAAGAADRPRSRRISFLIRKDGRIAHITDNRDAQVHLDELKQAVANLSH